MVNFRSRRYSQEINFIVVNIVVTRFRIGLFGVELRAFYCSQLSQLYIYLILPQNLTELGEQPTLHPRPRTHHPRLCTLDPRPTTHDPRLLVTPHNINCVMIGCIVVASCFSRVCGQNSQKRDDVDSVLDS